MNAVDFYEKNKDCIWKMPAAPADCSNDVELAHWLLIILFYILIHFLSFWVNHFPRCLDEGLADCRL